MVNCSSMRRKGEYVGGKEDPEDGGYTFRFGMGATAMTERMYLALMEPSQWSVSPCAVCTVAHDRYLGIPDCDPIPKGVPSASLSCPTPLQGSQSALCNWHRA